MGATSLAEMAESAIHVRRDGGKMTIFRQVEIADEELCPFT